MQQETSEELLHMKAELLGSLLKFTQVFYKIRTGRDFIVSKPIGRESHHITICRELTSVFNLDVNRLLINVEPGSGKSELCRHFVAWAIANYADSNFIYVSCSHNLAAKSTATIKEILELPTYRKLFDVKIDPGTSAKDNFKTTAGGGVYAAGSEGTIVGFDAGLPISDRFSGAYIMDDMHKPDEAASDSVRERVKSNFLTTGVQRTRSPKVPFIFIGQRVHDDDLPASLINKMDGHDWRKVVLRSIDEAGNVLNPSAHPRENLLKIKETAPYVFSSQFQQDPIPAGGALYKRDWFVLKEYEPEILATFITADTAETEHTYNDATSFSFWGVYKIMQNEVETDLYGLHWIDNVEIRVDPAYLENEFMSFYSGCMRHKVKPKIVAIEKKSTGVTLSATLDKIQGLQVKKIERNSISKCDRFIAIQGYVGAKLISLPAYSKHTQRCIDHMCKITANNSHRWDDTADTLHDAVKLTFIDKVIQHQVISTYDVETENIIKKLNKSFSSYKNLQENRKW